MRRLIFFILAVCVVIGGGYLVTLQPSELVFSGIGGKVPVVA